MTKIKLLLIQFNHLLTDILLFIFMDYGSIIMRYGFNGIYYKLKYLPAIISVDIIRNLDRSTSELSSGLEINSGKQLIIRLGCSTHRAGFLTSGFSSNLLADVSGGIGFKFNKMNLDVGFMNLGAAGYVIGFSISQKLD